MPPVPPMLAKSVPSIPAGAMSYEPKWDGFRSVIFRDRDEVEIGSRNERPMTRYFPEIVAAVLASLPERSVVDGEIVIPDEQGRCLDFEALLQRIHPADSRVRLLAEQTPAAFVAFDLLALGDTDYTGEPFSASILTRLSAGWIRCSNASKSRRRPSPSGMTISPSITQRSGRLARTASTISGK